MPNTRRKYRCVRVHRCVQCGKRPQRSWDYFCGEACRRQHEIEHARPEVGRDTVEMQGDTGGAIYAGGRRLNLQNSA